MNTKLPQEKLALC